MRKQFRKAVRHLHSRSPDVAAADGQAAGHNDQAIRVEFRRLVDRSPVVVHRRCAANRIRRGKEAAAAQAGDPKSGRPDRSRGIPEVRRVKLLPPRIDSGEAESLASSDGILDRRIPAESCRIERQASRVSEQIRHRSQ